MLEIMCGRNPSKTVSAVEGAQQGVPYFSGFIENSWMNYLIFYIGRGQHSKHATHVLIPGIFCIEPKGPQSGHDGSRQTAFFASYKQCLRQWYVEYRKNRILFMQHEKQKCWVACQTWVPILAYTVLSCFFLQNISIILEKVIWWGEMSAVFKYGPFTRKKKPHIS